MRTLQLAAGVLSLIGISESKKANILFVVADDYGWNDIGYHQNKVSGANPHGWQTTNEAAGVMMTPTLDQLASEGVKLESYYVQPLCSPTRSTFMTGRYPVHTGIGPDVIGVGRPYGVPGREVMVPELLRDAGYDTHGVGKWHLGTCDERYMPTFRGFNSYSGYMAGAEDYYHHSGDWRNGSKPDTLMQCGDPDKVSDNYSTTLILSEVTRVVTELHDKTKPLYLYLAFQNVHNPYEAPPTDIVNINTSYPHVQDPTRKIYGGMVTALDIAVTQVVDLYKQNGLWEDTVMIFTTDNGGIGPGNNYPLRGMKVLDWEGGIRGVSFVRGTDSDLQPVPAGEIRNQLMHSTDWLPTLVEGIAGGSTSKTMPLDGHNQWTSITTNAATNRTMIIHNLPSKTAWTNGSTTTCVANAFPDSIKGGCPNFGITGGAIRVGDLKLLKEGVKGESSNNPVGTPQYRPKGFTPTDHNDTTAQPINGWWLFNISSDPWESINLAETQKDDLDRLVKIWDSIATAPDTVADLSWSWGIVDPMAGHHPNGSHCMGPFVGSSYCAYGTEFDCFIKTQAVVDRSTATVSTQSSPTGCQSACLSSSSCKFWTFDVSDKKCYEAEKSIAFTACESCISGPDACPK
eukprot:TRINITY_DN716_c0_g1_i1.p1 TRINITY_DN716_c0_g1~~TRINITY_DN716_c0_g1_i1.p1  ORF type:complete len:628 (+),score=143.83 TRINITY_DN716_c0_g1_i1:42-1925(+)